MLNQKLRIDGIELVFINLCKGLELLGINFEKNLSFNKLQIDDIVIILGNGTNCLNGYNKPNPIIAGIGLMNHPSEWPNLFHDYPVQVYLQHSDWALEIYKKVYHESCEIWPVGIDSNKWKPISSFKTKDIIIYDKIRFNRKRQLENILMPIEKFLIHNNISYEIIQYGFYKQSQYFRLLDQAKAMLFLCEHESQGMAYQQALSMNVPILAWDQGKWLDPNRFKWGDVNTNATSVPYFDDRCGLRFKSIDEFDIVFTRFWKLVNINYFLPREYITEYLTLEKSAERMLEIIKKWIK